MSPMLKNDLEYVLPRLSIVEQRDPQRVRAAIEGLLPERKGAYPLTEIEAALNELARK